MVPPRVHKDCDQRDQPADHTCDRRPNQFGKRTGRSLPLSATGLMVLNINSARVQFIPVPQAVSGEWA
jgi:hypothetical protein